MEIPPSDYEPKANEEGVGPFMAIIIVVGLLLAGGIYFFTMQQAEQPAPIIEEQENSY